MTIPELIKALEAADGPSREFDYEIGLATGYTKYSNTLDDGTICVTYVHPEYDRVWHGAIGACTPEFSASVDAAISLCERVLPGWGWRVATCCVSDDAWVFPDFNSPIHGERLKSEFRQDVEWTDITDVDLRPPGRPAIALCLAVLHAIEEIEEPTK